MHDAVLKEKDSERHEAMLEAMLQVAGPSGHHIVWIHKVDCKWSVNPGPTCKCQPRTIIVLPAAHA